MKSIFYAHQFNKSFSYASIMHFQKNYKFRAVFNGSGDGFDEANFTYAGSSIYNLNRQDWTCDQLSLFSIFSFCLYASTIRESQRTAVLVELISRSYILLCASVTYTRTYVQSMKSIFYAHQFDKSFSCLRNSTTTTS